LNISAAEDAKRGEPEMKMETAEEYQEKKAWIEDYIKRLEKLRGPERLLTEEDKEITKKALMESLRLH